MFRFLAHSESLQSIGSSFSIRCSARLAALQQQKSMKAMKTRMEPISIFPIYFSFPRHNVICSCPHTFQFILRQTAHSYGEASSTDAPSASPHSICCLIIVFSLTFACRLRPVPVPFLPRRISDRGARDAHSLAVSF